MYILLGVGRSECEGRRTQESRSVEVEQALAGKPFANGNVAVKCCTKVGIQSGCRPSHEMQLP